MKRAFIIGGGIAGVIVVAVVAIVALVATNIDGIIKDGVEGYGSEIVKARVTLESVDVSSSGKAALVGLVVGNPAGFKTDNAVRLGSVTLDIDIGTVMEKTVLIREIAVDGPEITYELGPKGSNIDALNRNVQSYLGRDRAAKKAGAAKKDGRKLIIAHIYIRGGKISVSASILGGRTLSVSMPDIHLTDIGKDTGGASPVEVAERVMKAITGNVAKAIASLGVKGLVGGNAAERLKKMGVDGIARKLGDGTGISGAMIEKGAGEAAKALKGLFGK